MGTQENFDTYAHQRIWDEIHGGAGVSPQTGSQWGWYLLAGRLENIRSYVDTAIAGVNASREGAAADAATGAMTPLGTWVDEARRLAHETATKIAEQNGSFSTTQSSIPEVVPVPESTWRDWPVISSFNTSDHEVQEAQAKEQERIARLHMTSYQEQTNTRLAVMPQFLPPQPTEGGLDTPAGTKPGVGEATVRNLSTNAAGTSAGGGGAADGSGGSVTPFSGVGGGQAGSGGYQAPAATGSQGYTPPGGTAGSGAPTGTAGGGVAGGSSGGGVGAGAGGVGAPGFAGGPGGGIAGGLGGGNAGRGSGTGTGGRGAGGRAAGTGSGRFGATGAGAGGGAARGAGGRAGTGGGGMASRFGPSGGGAAGAAGGSAGGAGAAGGPRGFGPSGAGGFGPGGAGTAGGARGGMGPMMGGMAGGRGQGGDDSEHERPTWLVEQDPNAIVGDLPRTAPPVIGEDPPEAGR